MFHGTFGYLNPEPQDTQPFLVLRSKTCNRPIVPRPQIHRSVSDSLQIPLPRRQIPQKRPSEDGELQSQVRRMRRVDGTLLRTRTSPEHITPPGSLAYGLAAHTEVARSVKKEHHDAEESVLSLSEQFDESPDDNTLTDVDASDLMRLNFSRRQRNSLPERLLLQILNARVKLDDDALYMIARSADRVFFDGKLHGRMSWKWSLPHQSRFENEVVGTTGLRRAKDGGFETRIILSKPLLTNENYDKRLLLSTFLHELIHCYLFICCGFQAKKCGGHTEGFRVIAKIIDQWASKEGGVALGLCDMDANLNDFRVLSVPVYVGPSKRGAVCCGDSFHVIREAMIVEDDWDRKAWYIPPSEGF